MPYILHKADTRGLADHGWLLSRHSFSFANYHNPERIGFGLLRVINDDIVKPARGFATHPHENMEIISIPLTGSLRHQDSIGNQHVICAGEVQLMSAGTGVTHSEYNNSDQQAVNFLQIWVLPQQRNGPPRYAQKRFAKADRRNRWQTIIAPRAAGDALEINQQAWFSMTALDSGSCLDYQKHAADSGVYLFLIEGSVRVAGDVLSCRDGLAITGSEQIEICALNQSELLLMEVPMT